MNGIADIKVPLWGKIALGAIGLIAVVNMFGSSDSKEAGTENTNTPALSGLKPDKDGSIAL